MFLPRPLFHINYYGNLDKDGTWLRPNISYRNDDRLNSLELYANDVKRISPEGLAISENRKRKNKKPKQRNGQLLQDQFILRRPEPQMFTVFGTGKTEGNFQANEKIKKNQTESWIDAYKQPSMSSRPLDWTEIEFTSDNSPKNITTRKCLADKKTVTSSNPKPQSYFGKSEDKTQDTCIAKELILAPRICTIKYPIEGPRIQQNIESTDTTKEPVDARRIQANIIRSTEEPMGARRIQQSIPIRSTKETIDARRIQQKRNSLTKDPGDGGRTQQNRISITKDPINARRIQQCEQAKLMARYASDKTGLSVTDIYTGRISFTDKSRMKTETTETDADRKATHVHSHKDSIVCTTQPRAIPRWANNMAGFHDSASDNSSSDWTTTTSGCETEEPAVTLQEVRDHMCYYVFCCGLCIE